MVEEPESGNISRGARWPGPEPLLTGLPPPNRSLESRVLARSERCRAPDEVAAQLGRSSFQYAEPGVGFPSWEERDLRDSARGADPDEINEYPHGNASNCVLIILVTARNIAPSAKSDCRAIFVAFLNNYQQNEEANVVTFRWRVCREIGERYEWRGPEAGPPEEAAGLVREPGRGGRARMGEMGSSMPGDMGSAG
jgi:hypothetical protein